MSLSRALKTFRQNPWKYNCAQSISAAFGREDMVPALGSCGGGRAPEGLCGALYGAITVAPYLREQLTHSFLEKRGAITCHDLKRKAGADCRLCVSTAAGLLEEFLNLRSQA